MLPLYHFCCNLYYLHHSQINRHCPSGKGHMYCCISVQYVLKCYQLCHHTRRGIITPFWTKTSGIYHWIHHHLKTPYGNKKRPCKTWFCTFQQYFSTNLEVYHLYHFIGSRNNGFYHTQPQNYTIMSTSWLIWSSSYLYQEPWSRGRSN